MIKKTYNLDGSLNLKGKMTAGGNGFAQDLYAALNKSLNNNPELANKALSMYKAMDTQTTLEGKNVVDEVLFRGVLEKIKLFGEIAPLFDDIQLPSQIYKLPIELEGAKVFLTGEATQDNNDVTASASTPTIGLSTIEAFKLTGKSLTSEELAEDSVIDIIRYIVEAHAEAIARGFDRVIIDGDKATSHQDSDVTSGRDERKGANGLRKLTLANPETIVNGATFSLDRITDALAKMGKFGGPRQLRNVVLITGLSVYNKLLALALNTANNNQVAFDIQSGVLRSINGIRIIVSEDVRQDLNDNGVFDNVTKTKTYALLVNTSQFITGTRSVARFESDKDYDRDQIKLYSRIRKGFAPLFITSASNTNAVIICNITS